MRKKNKKGRPAMDHRKKRRPITVSMLPDLLEALENIREETGESISSLSERAIIKLLHDESRGIDSSAERRNIPMLRAAAGAPMIADAEHVDHDESIGEGRFFLELRGDSMEPRFSHGQRVILREKATLKRPVLKYGEFYCFVHAGATTFKQWAKDKDGRKVLRSMNPDYPDIPADEETDWVGWFDPTDND